MSETWFQISSTACLLLFIAVGIYMPLKLVADIYKASKTDITREYSSTFIVSEILILVLLPWLGFTFCFDKYPSGEHPFAYPEVISIIIVWAVSVSCYWISRLKRKSFSPLVEAILPIGMLAGIVLCFFTAIHFANYVLIGWIFPILGLPLLSPYLSFFLLLRELCLNHLRFRRNYTQLQIPEAGTLQYHIHEFLSNKLLMKLPGLFIGLIPFLVVLQPIFILFDQSFDSLFNAFSDSCGFILSDKKHCSSGSAHYLCTVAAKGNPKLVRPVRSGIRRGHIITVNRQLMIANAFEQWLEERIPAIHKIIRRNYDKLEIPINRLAHYKYAPEIIYLLMKPVEWGFLIWLYAFDKNPEIRIAKQYSFSKV